MGRNQTRIWRAALAAVGIEEVSRRPQVSDDVGLTLDLTPILPPADIPQTFQTFQVIQFINTGVLLVIIAPANYPALVRLIHNRSSTNPDGAQTYTWALTTLERLLSPPGGADARLSAEIPLTNRTGPVPATRAFLGSAAIFSHWVAPEPNDDLQDNEFVPLTLLLPPARPLIVGIDGPTGAGLRLTIRLWFDDFPGSVRQEIPGF